MVSCMGCGQEPHDAAPACTRCGEPRLGAAMAYPVDPGVKENPLRNAAITSLVLGVLCVLALFDGSEWHDEATAGMALFSVVGLALGIISLRISRQSRGMAVAGIVVSVIGLLACLWLV